MVNVQSRTACVVVDPRNLESELFPSTVVRSQGEQIRALNHVAVEARCI